MYNQSLSEIPKPEKTPKHTIPKEDKFNNQSLNELPKPEKAPKIIVTKEEKSVNKSINELPKNEQPPQIIIPKESKLDNQSLNDVHKNEKSESRSDVGSENILITLPVPSETRENKVPSMNEVSKSPRANNSGRASLQVNIRAAEARENRAPSMNEFSKTPKADDRGRASLQVNIRAAESREDRVPSMSEFSKTPQANNSGRASLTANTRTAEPEKVISEQVSIKSESENSRASELFRQNNDNERPEESSSYSSNHMHTQSTNMNSFLEKETVETPNLPDELQSAGYDENSEDKLDLELLNSTVSVLKKRTMADVEVPGNQRIIRRIKTIPEDSPDKKRSSLQGYEASMIVKKTLSHSMTANPEDALEKFEREDYEAARILSVDESIKNFLVSENPSANEYTVPLTKLVPLNDMSRPFYFAFEGQPTELGRPTTIRV